MTFVDDRDIVRALGFVTLYAAYVEEAIDECLDIVVTKDVKPPKKLMRFPTSQKIEYISGRLAEIDLPQELSRFPELLEYLENLFEDRNEVIHGRIYGGTYGGVDILRSNRRGNPDREVASLELYELAECFMSTLQNLNHASMYSLPRLMNGLGEI